MKILVLSDSLGLPREEPEYCGYNSVYSSLLKRKGHIVHQVSIGGATSADLLRQMTYHKVFKPDVVVLQVGIVDCTPRFATKVELALFKRLGWLGQKTMKLLNNRKIRRLRKISYVTIEKFKSNVKNIVHSFSNSRVIILGIVPAKKEYEVILPGVTKNIELYNNFLKTVGNHYVDMEVIKNTGVMSDFHHLNDKGHMYVYTKLLDVL